MIGDDRAQNAGLLLGWFCLVNQGQLHVEVVETRLVVGRAGSHAIDNK